MAVVSLFEGITSVRTEGEHKKLPSCLSNSKVRLQTWDISDKKQVCPTFKQDLRISCFSFALGPFYRNFHYSTDAPTSVQKRVLFKLSPVSTLFTTLPPCASASYTVQHRLLLTWSSWLASRFDHLHLRTKILDSHRIKRYEVPKLLWVQRKLWRPRL
jgi:hypothetical protein